MIQPLTRIEDKEKMWEARSIIGDRLSVVADGGEDATEEGDDGDGEVVDPGHGVGVLVEVNLFSSVVDSLVSSLVIGRDVSHFCSPLPYLANGKIFFPSVLSILGIVGATKSVDGVGDIFPYPDATLPICVGNEGHWIYGCFDLDLG